MKVFGWMAAGVGLAAAAWAQDAIRPGEAAVRAAVQKALPQAAEAAQKIAVQAAAALPAMPEGTTADVPGFGDLTVITADLLVYDGLRHFVELQGRVVVSDPGMKMKADTVRIEMEGTNQVKRIIAVGHVVLTQEDKQAWAGRATHDVAAGTFVLEESPRVMRGRDMMMGRKITFWRGEDRMECSEDARLIIQPDPARKTGFLNGGR